MFAYSDNGLASRSVDGPSDILPGEVYFAAIPTAAQLAAAFPGYAAAVAAQQVQTTAAALLAAGIAIVCTSGGFSATFEIDGPAATNIDGIYSGIENGAGLPGNGTTFDYPDVTGTMHAFTAANFPEFAKAVRDYRYQIAQGQTPATPVTIA
jgi:hypothetical protein